MDWYKNLYRLQFITRYSNIPRVRDENVAQHSFFVASLCLEIMEGLDKSKFSQAKVLTMAITHDWAEADIDDIAHNVKRDFPAIKKVLKVAERKVMSKYPNYIQDIFQEYDEANSIEASIVQLADTLQCVQYLESEVKLGNRYMEPMLEESRDYLPRLEAKLLEIRI